MANQSTDRSKPFSQWWHSALAAAGKGALATALSVAIAIGAQALSASPGFDHPVWVFLLALVIGFTADAWLRVSAGSLAIRTLNGYTLRNAWEEYSVLKQTARALPILLVHILALGVFAIGFILLGILLPPSELSPVILLLPMLIVGYALRRLQITPAILALRGGTMGDAWHEAGEVSQALKAKSTIHSYLIYIVSAGVAALVEGFAAIPLSGGFAWARFAVGAATLLFGAFYGLLHLAVAQGIATSDYFMGPQPNASPGRPGGPTADAQSMGIGPEDETWIVDTRPWAS